MSSFGSVPEGSLSGPPPRADSVSGPPPRAGHARAVEQDYDRRTAEWREIYAGATFHDHLIRRRLELTLDLVDGATSGAGGASLDVGCGAGQLVVEMARRGYRAAGCDISAGMVAETRGLLAREGLPGRVEQADVERLAYPDGEFAWVTALGVIEYLASPPRGLHELVRVLARGGHLVVTAPNPMRLAYLADPIGVVRGRLAPPAHGYRRHYWTRGQLRRAVGAAGLEVLALQGHGLGPFTIAGYRLMGDTRSIALGDRLERRLPASLVNLLGSNLIALARKP